MPRGSMICATCYEEGPAKTVNPGNFAVELVLWLLLLFPGLVYSVWRLSATYKACRACGGKDLIPPGSPRANVLRQQKLNASIPTPVQSSSPDAAIESPAPAQTIKQSPSSTATLIKVFSILALAVLIYGGCFWVLGAI